MPIIIVSLPCFRCECSVPDKTLLWRLVSSCADFYHCRVQQVAYIRQHKCGLWIQKLGFEVKPFPLIFFAFPSLFSFPEALIALCLSHLYPLSSINSLSIFHSLPLSVLQSFLLTSLFFLSPLLRGQESRDGLKLPPPWRVREEPGSSAVAYHA